MRYLLDTDTCIYALKRHEAVVQQVLSHRRSELAISVITEAELRFGAATRASPRGRAAIEAWLLRLETLDFTSAEAEAYADIRARLRRAGTPIGELDTLIAAHALAQDLVLVTNNVREFRRVPGLALENWTA